MDRSRSASLRGVRTSDERAPHTLFKFAAPGSQAYVQETLEFHIFYDGSVIEIFVNQRTAITTRVYPSSGSSVALTVLVEDLCGGKSTRDGAELLHCDFWPLRR